MSILDEMDDPDGYDRMVFVEFIEFISRCSSSIYASLNEHLGVKIEMFLDKFLPPFGFKRKPVPTDAISSSSESEGGEL